MINHLAPALSRFVFRLFLSFSGSPFLLIDDFIIISLQFHQITAFFEGRRFHVSLEAENIPDFLVVNNQLLLDELSQPRMQYLVLVQHPFALPVSNEELLRVLQLGHPLLLRLQILLHHRQLQNEIPAPPLLHLRIMLFQLRE